MDAAPYAYAQGACPDPGLVVRQCVRESRSYDRRPDDAYGRTDGRSVDRIGRGRKLAPGKTRQRTIRLGGVDELGQ